jgi:hypothetical protein
MGARFRHVLAMAVVIAAMAIPAGAWVVVLKDGSKIFAQKKYDVKDANAIIVLENGNITQIPLSQIDVPGSDEYNKENVGNVIALTTPKEQSRTPPPAASSTGSSLSQFIRERRREAKARPEPDRSEAAAASANRSAGVSALVDREAQRIFAAAGIDRYKMRAGPTAVFVADDEDSVFQAMTAAARLALDLGEQGKVQYLDVEILSSKGETGGKFRMTAVDVADLVAGKVTPSEYFVKNVIF